MEPLRRKFPKSPSRNSPPQMVPVCAETCPVPDDTETGTVQSVIRHTGCHVSPMMLHADQRHTLGGRGSCGFLCGQVIRMEVADIETGLQAE